MLPPRRSPDRDQLAYQLRLVAPKSCPELISRKWYYRPLASLIGSANPAYLHMAGAVMIISAADGTAVLKRLLQSRPSRFLGRISFPLYLIHIPVLCSAGCSMVLATAPFAGVKAAGSAALLTVPIHRGEDIGSRCRRMIPRA